MLDILRQDFVRTARAKGLVERGVVLRHALRNALVPVITLGALEFGQLFLRHLIILARCEHRPAIPIMRNAAIPEALLVVEEIAPDGFRNGPGLD